MNRGMNREAAAARDAELPRAGSVGAGSAGSVGAVLRR